MKEKRKMRKEGKTNLWLSNLRGLCHSGERIAGSSVFTC